MGLLVNGGGSGVPKSKLVRAATQAINVLKGTFFVNSSGNVTEGAMDDYQGQKVILNEYPTEHGGYINIGIPARGCYDTDSKIKMDPARFGDADVAHVLSGRTFTSFNGPNIAGTMPNYGNTNIQASVNTDVAIPKGYYNGSGKVKGPILSGNAPESMVMAPYKFYSNNGTLRTGTRTNVGTLGTPTVSDSLTQGESQGTTRSASIPVTQGATYVLTFSLLENTSWDTAHNDPIENLAGITVSQRVAKRSSTSSVSTGRYIATVTITGVASAEHITFNYNARINTYSLLKVGE